MVETLTSREMYLLNWEQFSHYWGTGIQDALRMTDFYEYYTDEWLFDGVLKGNIQVFVLSDGVIKAIFFTQIVEYPGHTVIRCFWGCGAVEKFIAIANERLEEMAQVAGADRIELVGRWGWYRMLKKIIPEVEHGPCTVWRPVKPQRRH